MLKNIVIENPYISITVIEIFTLHKMLSRKLKQQLETWLPVLHRYCVLCNAAFNFLIFCNGYKIHNEILY